MPRTCQLGKPSMQVRRVDVDILKMARAMCPRFAELTRLSYAQLFIANVSHPSRHCRGVCWKVAFSERELTQGMLFTASACLRRILRHVRSRAAPGVDARIRGRPGTGAHHRSKGDLHGALYPRACPRLLSAPIAIPPTIAFGCMQQLLAGPTLDVLSEASTAAGLVCC